MVMEIVGSREEVRAVTKSSALQETNNNVIFQVPYLYWVSYLTLQGNLMNIPFATGEVKAFPLLLIIMILTFQPWFPIQGGDLLCSDGLAKLA